MEKREYILNILPKRRGKNEESISKFQDREIPAEAVHYSSLASLSRYYARVVDTETFLKELED